MSSASAPGVSKPLRRLLSETPSNAASSLLPRLPAGGEPSRDGERLPPDRLEFFVELLAFFRRPELPPCGCVDFEDAATFRAADCEPLLRDALPDARACDFWSASSSELKHKALCSMFACREDRLGREFGVGAPGDARRDCDCIVARQSKLPQNEIQHSRQRPLFKHNVVYDDCSQEGLGPKRALKRVGGVRGVRDKGLKRCVWPRQLKSQRKKLALEANEAPNRSFYLQLHKRSATWHALAALVLLFRETC